MKKFAANLLSAFVLVAVVLFCVGLGSVLAIGLVAMGNWIGAIPTVGLCVVLVCVILAAVVTWTES